MCLYKDIVGGWSGEFAMWKKAQYQNTRWKTTTMKEVKKQWRSHYPAARNIPNTTCKEAEDE